MKKLFLTLFVAFATVCGFAQGESMGRCCDRLADPRNLDALESIESVVILNKKFRDSCNTALQG
ncbi:MAG: hypothetical protein IKW46_10035 [Bacteroidaceae bacterium]|nr:hypothetical protein [Bacteroidaceae bacterium]